MNEAGSVVFGLAVTMLLGMRVGDLLDHIEKNVLEKWGNQVPVPPHYPAKEWVDLVMAASPGGAELGFLERIVMFAALWVPSGATLIGGWLVFKVACKWKSWELGDIQKRGSENDASTTAWLEDARARLYRTESGHRRFVIGAAANIVCALAGVAAGKALWMVVAA